MFCLAIEPIDIEPCLVVKLLLKNVILMVLKKPWVFCQKLCSDNLDRRVFLKTVVRQAWLCVAGNKSWAALRLPSYISSGFSVMLTFVR